MKSMLMNVPMTKATLDDLKTNTRRAIKNTKYADFSSMKIDSKVYPNGKIIHYKFMDSDCSMFSDEFIKTYAKYQKSDTLWVREPAKVIFYIRGMMEYSYLADNTKDRMHVPYRFANDNAGNLSIKSKWIKNCQGIPNGCIKEMARIFLKVTNIRAERLQDITLGDIFKEGCPIDISKDLFTKNLNMKAIYSAYPLEKEVLNWWINLWNSTAPKGYKWEDNPYVFVYEFERVTK